MEENYWLERWEQKEIDFHQSDINPYLCQYWKELYLGQGGTVFVPLCGKSQDMLWLCKQGYKVLGVELSAIAAESFFKKTNLFGIMFVARNLFVMKQTEFVFLGVIFLI